MNARSDDREVARSLNLIIALSDSCRGRSELTEEDEEKLRGLAPELIPEFMGQPVRMEEVPARREARHGAGCVACGLRSSADWPRTDVARRRRGQAFVVVGDRNRTTCPPGMAKGHGVTAGGEHMNKTEMADRLASRTGLSKGAARDAVDGVFAVIGGALADGEDVRLPGFGSFRTKTRPARTGRDPRTGEAVSKPASASPTFKEGRR